MYIKKSEERIGVTLKYTRARARVKKKKYLKKNSGGNQSVSRVLFRQDRLKCQRVRNDFWSEGYFY